MAESREKKTNNLRWKYCTLVCFKLWLDFVIIYLRLKNFLYDMRRRYLPLHILAKTGIGLLWVIVFLLAIHFFLETFNSRFVIGNC